METSPNTPTQQTEGQLSSTQSAWVRKHIEVATVIGHYGDAIKKFDWFIHLVVFVLLVVTSLVACHYYGTSGALASLFSAIVSAAGYLVKGKGGT